MTCLACCAAMRPRFTVGAREEEVVTDDRVRLHLPGGLQFHLAVIFLDLLDDRHAGEGLQTPGLPVKPRDDVFLGAEVALGGSRNGLLQCLDDRFDVDALGAAQRLDRFEDFAAHRPIPFRASRASSSRRALAISSNGTRSRSPLLTSSNRTHGRPRHRRPGRPRRDACRRSATVA